MLLRNRNFYGCDEKVRAKWRALEACCAFSPALPAVAQLTAVSTVGSESEVAALAFVIVLAEEWSMG